jgi:hypothetical protein
MKKIIPLILAGLTLAVGFELTVAQENDMSFFLTSNGPGNGADLGHHDRLSFGKPGSPWNDAHPSRGCSQEDLQGTGGDGLFYCFAAD